MSVAEGESEREGHTHTHTLHAARTCVPDIIQKVEGPAIADVGFERGAAVVPWSRER